MRAVGADGRMQQELPVDVRDPCGLPESVRKVRPNARPARPGGKAAPAKPQTPSTPTITPGSGATASCTLARMLQREHVLSVLGTSRVSCGMCRPAYKYGGCRDHHEKCAGWRRPACRFWCQTCYTGRELSQICRLYKGRRRVTTSV
ncbi:hypothetical protein M3Y99_01006400 [Aphelenchoides fujianensis]|nr:hypothetical protein M3Y99_01006400 [Aphelenchoides fujianensis]